MFDLVQANPDSADVTINLPAADGTNEGESIVIKRVDDAAAFNVVVNPDGADTIEGDPSYTLSIAEASITVVSDGAGNWLII
jgi:hypothetical protein